MFTRLTALFSSQKKLGLWIDLTNTNRFYDRKEIDTRDCRYTKLQCRGHGETPSAEQRQSFFNIVDEFIQDHPLEMIGVHCTHGFNRTGFLIVSYMVEKMDCALEAALLAFAQARPPGIYKADYIAELYRLFEPCETPMAAPERPSWCFGKANIFQRFLYADCTISLQMQKIPNTTTAKMKWNQHHRHRRNDHTIMDTRKTMQTAMRAKILMGERNGEKNFRI